MGWIRERILSENKKHYRVTGGLDWARLAEQKIIGSIKERLKDKLKLYDMIITYEGTGVKLRDHEKERLIDELLSSSIQKPHFQPCGKDFDFMEADNIYVGVCGGEDGLCDECSKNIKETNK